MKCLFAAVVVLGLGLARDAPAQGLFGAGIPDQHRDAARLTWLVPGFVPDDGLLAVGLHGRRYTPQVLVSTGIAQYDVLEFALAVDATPLPGLAIDFEQTLRMWGSWYEGGPDSPNSGTGLGDGRLRAVFAVPGPPSWLGVTVWGGSNLPVGAAEVGEKAWSPHLGVSGSIRVWQDATLPEMRLHGNFGRRFNGNEAEGYGVNPDLGPQPWWPRYPDAASAGGDAANDFRLWGVALEFRKVSTALWFEYSAADLWRTDTVAPRENSRVFSAGLRWGLTEGWTLHGNYMVPLQRDDAATEYYPSLPQLVYAFGVSRQFSIGGRDRDGDGIPDRKDACPKEPEDPDGFEDEDGCPDEDNDRDGIPDRLDGAPDRPEDFDEWMDGDGIPDLDNDNDGIPDYRDLCPMEAEDLDGYHDEDGCPEEFIDFDQDGLADPEDGCPDRAEDLDGFQDEDGCPDPDNDLDGIPDPEDECPDEAEDYDGDQDEDGCPDVTEDEPAAPLPEPVPEMQPAVPDSLELSPEGPRRG